MKFLKRSMSVVILGLMVSLIPSSAQAGYYHHHHDHMSKAELVDIIKAQSYKIEQLEDHCHTRELALKVKYGILCGAAGVIVGFLLSKIK